MSGWRYVEGRVKLADLTPAEGRRRFEGPIVPVIYMLCGEDDSLLYIGISVNPMRRWHEHKYSKPWWSEVHEIVYRSISTTRLYLQSEERLCIQEFNPKYNQVRSDKGFEYFVGMVG